MAEQFSTAITSLPPRVKEWLASERVTYTIIDLHKRLNIKGDLRTVIPSVIFRLAAQELEPVDFINTLALELKVSDSAAKMITKEIEEKILHPIEDVLGRESGIDIALLHFPKEAMPEKMQEIVPPLFEPAKPAPIAAPAVPAPAPVTATPRPMPPKIEITPRIEPLVKTPELPKAAPSGPFILHKEKEEFKPAAPPASIGAPTPSARPPFSIKIPTQKKYYTGAPQVTARIETPPSPREGGASEGKPASAGQAPLPSEGQTPLPPAATAPVKPLVLPRGPLPFGPLSELTPKLEAPPMPKIAPAPPPTLKATEDKQKRQVEITPEGPVIKRVVHYSSFYTPLS